MSRILSAEEVGSPRYRYLDSTEEDGANDLLALCDSHEALRSERAAAEARVAELEAVLRECSVQAWHGRAENVRAIVDAALGEQEER